MVLLLTLQLLTRFLPGSYPKPWLGVQPAAVVTPGVNVTLRCQAPQPAWRFMLFKPGATTVHQNVSEEVAEFFLEKVTPAQGGSYHCCYQRLGWEHGVWSQPSDALELLVTGEGLGGRGEGTWAGVWEGRGVREIQGGLGRMSFALYREGTQAPLLYRVSELPWADFPLPAAGAAGTYSCYYHTPSAPYVLSARSPPLVIRSEDSDSSDYTQGNLIRLGLAGLVLISLVMLVVADWRGRRGAPGSRRPEAPQDWL
ncbi:PREDICTED: osteoclast-associated immunoglobulin-like receptor [Condylura cristata]|uniref:osteoclast-associated immunoglobulin-like receptor n=1 Tax=Condylura cristata TaxID=143302 RepID=UPI000643641C|nr:PREDICTED: osteoclast-associated immunoglobulin-like receptor [Condylura cristata]